MNTNAPVTGMGLRESRPKAGLGKPGWRASCLAGWSAGRSRRPALPRRI